MNIKKYVGDRVFYKSLLSVAIPVAIQNSITNFIGMLDNIMVGQIGTEQMTGVSIVNQLIFVFNLCIFGAVSAAGLFGAQFFGKGDHEGVRHSFRFKLLITAVILAVAIAIFWLLGEPLIGLYLHEGSETGDLALTMQNGKEYLAVMIWGLVPYALAQIYSTTLREIGHAMPPMFAGVAGVLVNLCLNYVLIFGKLGAPVMGVKGAAIATLISRFAELGIIILWTHLHSQKCEFIKGAYRSMRIPTSLVKRILVTGFPLMLNEMLWAMGMSVLLQCYSYRGIAVVSAINISNTVLNTASVLYLAIGTAISVLIGQRLGAGEREEAKDAAWKMILFSVFMGVLGGLVVAVVAPFFPMIYNTTHEVRGYATSFMFSVAAAMPLAAFVNATYFVLRSGGKTFVTFLFDSCYVWCVNVLLALILARFTSMPVAWVYFCCHMIDAIKCVIGGVLVKKGIWITDITGMEGESSTKEIENI